MSTTKRPPIDLLRFNTCGSVDDGKSTLIGRLLYDSKSLMEDQLEALERDAGLTGGGAINLANLTDGLRAEREQGITIDVAYRYFATPRRKFIVADTPGHVQYTRNMVTGASTANLAIVLVDARRGVTEQTRRHACISALLGIPHLVLAVNKMDLVDWSEERFLEIRAEVEDFLPKLDSFRDVKFVPISALDGGNVVAPAPETPWYGGPTLLNHLETVHIASDWNLSHLRLPVQWINRPHQPRDLTLHDFRGFSGQLAGGIVRTGQPVFILPSGHRSTVREIHTPEGPVNEAFCPQSVTVVLSDDLDISRGDMIVGFDGPPGVSSHLRARICWMRPGPLRPGARFFLKHTSRTVQAMVTELVHLMDIRTFEPEAAPAELPLNGIGEVRIKTSAPIVHDGYTANRLTGSFILIEPGTNHTVAAGMLLPPVETVNPAFDDFVI
ncbi:MAG: GTP-binding protein [Akkermansiaceae bacterium]|jgi:bifunctional enzyme CysN/CysC/sulfate adenylyltransferase subunit 1|nr:GTP-binding protein [Akkermansiaceae bacterium]